jgi:hypothetical protein
LLTKQSRQSPPRYASTAAMWQAQADAIQKLGDEQKARERAEAGLDSESDSQSNSTFL